MTNGLIGTAVNLAILGVGLSLFTGAVSQAQRNLEPKGRTRKTRRSDNLFDFGLDTQRKTRKTRNDVLDGRFF